MGGISWVDQYIGLPFKEHGRSRNGLDCYGLVYLVYKEVCGVELPTFSQEYSGSEDSGSVEKALQENIPKWKRVEGNWETFDVAVFYVPKFRRFLGHVGLIYDKDRMVHCKRPIGVVSSRVKKDLRYGRMLEGVYRYVR